MFKFIRNWLDSRIIQRSTITSKEWDQVASRALRNKNIHVQIHG